MKLIELQIIQLPLVIQGNALETMVSTTLKVRKEAPVAFSAIEVSLDEYDFESDSSSRYAEAT